MLTIPDELSLYLVLSVVNLSSRDGEEEGASPLRGDRAAPGSASLRSGAKLASNLAWFAVVERGRDRHFTAGNDQTTDPYCPRLAEAVVEPVLIQAPIRIILVQSN